MVRLLMNNELEENDGEVVRELFHHFAWRY
jgi:hypothetical protein